MKNLPKFLLIVGIYLTPFITSAQSYVVQTVTSQATSFPQTKMNLGTFVQALIKYVNLLTPVLASAAILFFFYGLVRYIYDAGNYKGHERGRQTIIWGLVGLFTVFCLWGILQFLQGIVFV